MDYTCSVLAGTEYWNLEFRITWWVPLMGNVDMIILQDETRQAQPCNMDG